MAPQQKSEQGTVHEITEENNIFRLRVADSLAYFVFYVAIPIFTAYASLARQSMSNNERIYSYVTIMISSLNCIYDACSRISNTPRAKKKLLLIICGAGTVFLYCLYIVCTIPLENMQWRCDYFLLVYSLVFIIALKEIAPCIAKIIK